jgi:hypothetical protein
MDDGMETLVRFIDKSYEVEAVVHVIFYVGIVISILIAAANSPANTAMRATLTSS